MIWRTIATAITLGIWGGLTNILSPIATLGLGKQAVQQLNPSDFDYLQTMGMFAAYRGVDWLITFLGVVLILSLWIGPIRRALKSKETGAGVATIFAVALGAMAFAPSPAHSYYDKQDYAEWRNIGANQSAFLIPAVGDNKTGQAQFGSAAYLDTKKVPAKRVQIPHVKLENSGIFASFNVPAATLIIVPRDPVYREWTDSHDKGTNKAKEGFTCESQDSLNITTAIAISATVSEENAHKFLYNFGVEPVPGDPSTPEVIFASVNTGVSLSKVMDTVIRGKVHAALCESLGGRVLDDVIKQKREIMKEVNDDVKAFATPLGITIGFVGLAGALDYDTSIQSAMNHVYTAKRNAEAAESLAPALPVLQQEADIQVKLGIAEGIKTKGIPTLPSFVVLPQSWIDAAAAFFNSAGK